jgi:hypothetical protein
MKSTIIGYVGMRQNFEKQSNRLLRSNLSRYAEEAEDLD